jgi:hypothetical protein
MGRNPITIKGCVMALAEFTAMETAYRALVALEPAARARALGWLTDALGTPGALPQEPAAAEPAAAPVPAVPHEPTPVAAPGRRGRTAAKATASRAARTSGPKPARTGATPRTRTSAPVPAERAYRRMPAVEEVMGAYRQVGTISGLAEFFNVPTHTVQGWARRLRKEGHDIGRAG